jgi:hypothetical protein
VEALNILSDSDHWRMQRKVVDTGYTKVCAICSQRFGAEQTLVAKEREIKIVERCDDCIANNRRGVHE